MPQRRAPWLLAEPAHPGLTGDRPMRPRRTLPAYAPSGVAGGVAGGSVSAGRWGQVLYCNITWHRWHRGRGKVWFCWTMKEVLLCIATPKALLNDRLTDRFGRGGSLGSGLVRRWGHLRRWGQVLHGRWGHAWSLGSGLVLQHHAASLAPWVGQGLVLLDDERGSALHCHPEGLVGNVAIQDLTPASSSGDCFACRVGHREKCCNTRPDPTLCDPTLRLKPARSGFSSCPAGARWPGECPRRRAAVRAQCRSPK